MTNKQNQFFARYDKGEQTYNICTDLKIPFYVAFMWLKKSGREVKENAISTLSDTQKVGYFGERLFKKYAPKALNINAAVKVNHPSWDFEYDYLKIDIKTARPKWNKKGVASWHFSHLKDRADDLIYIMFLLPDNQDEPIALDDIDEQDIGCLFLPSMLIEDGKKDMCFHEEIGWEKYGDFMIELPQIAEQLDMIVQAT